jgi:hypothetical protein
MENYFVKDFRSLIVYKRTLQLYKIATTNEDYDEADRFKMKKAISRIAQYIAKSTGDCLYVNFIIYDLNKALKWTYEADKLLKNKVEKNELSQIRKMIFGLKKKMEEVKK